MVFNGHAYPPTRTGYNLKGSRIELDRYYLIYCDYEDMHNVKKLPPKRIDSLWYKKKWFIVKTLGRHLPYVLPSLEWDYNLTEVL